MNNRFSGKTTLAALSVALMLLAAPASAQTPILSFHVPFAFTAGDQVLAPGPYHVTVDIDRMGLLFNPKTSTKLSFVRFAPGDTRPAANSDNGMLRFQKWGDHYFLIGVWRPGHIDGHNVVPSRHLVESAKAEAGREIAPSTTNLQ